MVLLDVNVLVNALRDDAPRHPYVRYYVDSLRQAPQPFGLCDLALSGAMRVLTHPRVFTPPTPPAIALSYLSALRSTPNAVIVAPGSRHWQIFTRLVAESSATGNLVSDAWYAALAMEHGCDWISDGVHFARFPGLQWRKPG